MVWPVRPCEVPGDHITLAKFNSHLETSIKPFQRNKVIMHRYVVSILIAGKAMKMKE